MEYPNDPKPLTTEDMIAIRGLAAMHDAVWDLNKRHQKLQALLEQERRERAEIIDAEVFDRMAQATTTEATRYFRDALAVFKVGNTRYVVQPGWGDRPEVNALRLGPE